MSRLVLDDVHLSYPLYGGHARSLKRAVLELATGGRIERRRQRTVVTALSGISFALGDGDRLAVLGHNGAGKTTLLKVLTGAFCPDRGSVLVAGRMAGILDVSLGMEAELTGYENIGLRGMLLGLDREALRAMTADIEDFTELGEFLAMPVKTYSSGMQVRLAFALSTAHAPEILVVDEVIGAGDQGFFRKAQLRMEALIRRSHILVLSSHSIDIARQFCNRMLWLEHGRIRACSAIDDLLPDYRRSLAS